LNLILKISLIRHSNPKTVTINLLFQAIIYGTTNTEHVRKLQIFIIKVNKASNVTSTFINCFTLALHLSDAQHRQIQMKTESDKNITIVNEKEKMDLLESTLVIWKIKL